MGIALFGLNLRGRAPNDNLIKIKKENNFIPEARVDTVRLQRIVRAYHESAALMAVIEPGLFTRIAQGADTEEGKLRANTYKGQNGESK